MPSEHARHWSLDPGIDFLNHGAYGAAPRPVLDAQQAWRDELERDPMRFMAEAYEPALDAARRALGAFVGTDPDDLAFLTNATTGVSTVLRSLSFEPGDELLTLDHAYNAVRNAMEYTARRAGARVVVAEVPFPLHSAAQVRDAVLGAVGERTRLVVLDHVTSATALVLPVAELVRELSERGVETLIDGAHAPGMVDMDIEAIGAAYYAANLHKWVCAPKGAGFLWVRRDRQADIRPLVISHGANSSRTDRSRFRLEFDWLGTRDPTSWLAVPTALEFGASLLPGGWPALRRRNHQLTLEARDLLLAACGTPTDPPPAPDEMIGSMASIPLAWERELGRVLGVDLYGDPLHGALLAQGIQVQVAPWPQHPGIGRWRRLLRVSAAAYNDRAQFERLAQVLPAVLAAAS